MKTAVRSIRTIVYSFACLFVLILSSMVTKGTVVSVPTPANYWKFDEATGTTLTDSTGPSNGTLVGTVTRVSGVSSNALRFSGDGSYADFGASASNFGTNNFTVSLWIKTSATAVQPLLAKRPDCNMDFGPSWWDIRADAPDRFVPSTGAYALCIAGVHNQGITSIPTKRILNDGSWHHVAWQRQGTVLRVFVDGTFDNSTNTPLVIDVSNDAPLTLGTSTCDSVDGTYPYAGSVDDVRIYNTILTSNQIASVYSSMATNIVSDCAQNVLQLQGQLAAANTSNAVLSAQISSLQSNLTTANGTIAQLQSQLLTSGTFNTTYSNALLNIQDEIDLLSTNFAAKFKHADFTIPGDTLDLQVSNVVSGVLILDIGAQYRLFKYWSAPKKTTSSK